MSKPGVSELGRMKPGVVGGRCVTKRCRLLLLLSKTSQQKLYGKVFTKSRQVWCQMGGTDGMLSKRVARGVKIYIWRRCVLDRSRCKRERDWWFNKRPAYIPFITATHFWKKSSFLFWNTTGDHVVICCCWNDVPSPTVRELSLPPTLRSVKNVTSKRFNSRGRGDALRRLRDNLPPPTFSLSRKNRAQGL